MQNIKIIAYCIPADVGQARIDAAAEMLGASRSIQTSLEEAKKVIALADLIESNGVWVFKPNAGGH